MRPNYVILYMYLMLIYIRVAHVTRFLNSGKFGPPYIFDIMSLITGRHVFKMRYMIYTFCSNQLYYLYNLRFVFSNIAVKHS